MGDDLIKTLRERSREIAPEYPNIMNDLDPHEHLWAITETCKGISLANDDCHKFIKFLLSKLGWSIVDAISQGLLDETP